MKGLEVESVGDSNESDLMVFSFYYTVIHCIVFSSFFLFF